MLEVKYCKESGFGQLTKFLLNVGHRELVTHGELVYRS